MKKRQKEELLLLNQEPLSNRTFQVESVSHEGRGLAKHASGKKIFIEGALLGEQVAVDFTFVHSRFLEARVIEILSASSHRVEPRCPHFSMCGGCLLQHMTGDAQIHYKENMLREQLMHIGGGEPKEGYLPPVVGPLYGYRRRARLSVKFVQKKQKVLVGFREKHSPFLVEMSRCEVLDPRVGEKIEAIKQMIETLSIKAHIPQIEVAASDTRVALIFRFLEDPLPSDQETILNFCREHGFEFYSQRHKADSIVRIPYQENDELMYALPDFSLRFFWKNTDFTQVNPVINEQMVSLAVQLLALEKTDVVLDLFCGLGNFTLPIATRAQSVVGVEGSDEMVSRASQNARINHIENVTFFAQNLFEDFSGAAWASMPFRKILMDPPRAGAEKVSELMALFPQVERIVYVSCHPATLARDVAILARFGFRLMRAGVMDMFPHTQHVESIALLVRSMPL